MLKVWRITDCDPQLDFEEPEQEADDSKMVFSAQAGQLYIGIHSV